MSNLKTAADSLLKIAQQKRDVSVRRTPGAAAPLRVAANGLVRVAEDKRAASLSRPGRPS